MDSILREGETKISSQRSFRSVLVSDRASLLIGVGGAVDGGRHQQAELGKKGPKGRVPSGGQILELAYPKTDHALGEVKSIASPPPMWFICAPFRGTPKPPHQEKPSWDGALYIAWEALIHLWVAFTDDGRPFLSDNSGHLVIYQKLKRTTEIYVDENTLMRKVIQVFEEAFPIDTGGRIVEPDPHNGGAPWDFVCKLVTVEEAALQLYWAAEKKKPSHRLDEEPILYFGNSYDAYDGNGNYVPGESYPMGDPLGDPTHKWGDYDSVAIPNVSGTYEEKYFINHCPLFQPLTARPIPSGGKTGLPHRATGVRGTPTPPANRLPGDGLGGRGVAGVAGREAEEGELMSVTAQERERGSSTTA